MIERIRWNWRHFASGRAGLRFRERYRLHQSRRRGGFDIIRISYILGGALLIAMSVLLGWLPILGWGTAILGLSMIAGEFYPVARLMDWLQRCALVLNLRFCRELISSPRAGLCSYNPLRQPPSIVRLNLYEVRCKSLRLPDVPTSFYPQTEGKSGEGGIRTLETA